MANKKSSIDVSDILFYLLLKVEGIMESDNHNSAVGVIWLLKTTFVSI